MEEKQPQTGRVPIKKILIALVLVALTLLAVAGLVAVLRRPRLPQEIPTELEILPDDPDKTPLFSGGQAVKELSFAGTKTPSISGSVAILADLSSSDVLAAKNADARYQPASLTKVMTLIVACERLSQEDLDATVTMTEEIFNYARAGGYKGASNFPLDPGDTISVRDLLFGIGVKSYADCTILLVRKLAESEEAFVGWMNEKARALGMKNTHFDNAIGYESKENYSTAADLVRMMGFALQCDLIKEILSAPSYEFYYSGYNSKGEWKEGIHGTFFSTLFNANGTGRIADYEKSTGKKFKLDRGSFKGGKTGSLKLDGAWAYSLISFAEIDGKTYVSVVGNSASSAGLMIDVKALYDSYAK